MRFEDSLLGNKAGKSEGHYVECIIEINQESHNLVQKPVDLEPNDHIECIVEAQNYDFPLFIYFDNLFFTMSGLPWRMGGASAPGKKKIILAGKYEKAGHNSLRAIAKSNMAAGSEGESSESLADLFELQDSERLLEFNLYDSGGTRFKGRESSSLSVLNKLRLEGEAGFCDVTLEVEGRPLTTHRCVLAANSQFFYTMFSSGLKESNQKLLSLPSVCFTSLSLILDYFYTREIVINDENLLDLLNASSFLLVTPVKNACIQVLSNNLSNESCFRALQIAEQFGADELAEQANDYIKTNFSTVVNNIEFVTISQKDLVRFISSDDIQVEKEEEVYQSVLTWVKHDEANRVQALPELLKHLRKDSLPKGFLESELTREPLLKMARNNGDHAFKNIVGTKGTKIAKKAKSEKSVQELRPSTEIKNVMIGIGNGGPRKAFFYDLDKKEMLLLTDVPELELLQQIAVVGRTLYVIGGNIFSDIRRLSAVSFDDLKNPVSSASETMELELQPKTPFSKPRVYASLVSLNGLLYYIGGICHKSDSCQNTVECYNPELGEWSFCAGLNTPRHRSGCVASEQNIYVIGGGTKSVYSSKPLLSSVEKYDPERNSWSYVADLKEARSVPGCVYWGGKIYVIGGIDSARFYIYSCEVYSPMTDEWQTIARLPSLYARIDSNIVIIKNQITIAFTEPTLGTDISCEALQYNVQSNRWLKIKNLGPGVMIGTFALCTMKLPVLILRRIAGEGCQEDWNSSDEKESNNERSFLE